MKELFASTCLAASMLCFASSAHSADCGDVTIASMNWQSAEVLASLDKFILNEGYGCNADIIQGDTVPTITSMTEKAQPDIAPEGWVDLLPDVVNGGISSGKLVVASTVLTDGAVQGWWMPKYIADAHPDIKTIDDLLKHPELFPDPEDKSKGAIHNGPQGWGGTVVTAQLTRLTVARRPISLLSTRGPPPVSMVRLPRPMSAKRAGSAIIGPPLLFLENMRW